MQSKSCTLKHKILENQYNIIFHGDLVLEQKYFINRIIVENYEIFSKTVNKNKES